MAKTTPTIEDVRAARRRGDSITAHELFQEYWKEKEEAKKTAMREARRMYYENGG
jgi:predicted metal-dependent hydrolase